MEQRTRFQNIILIILAVMTAAFFALLLYNRSQSGIMFREAFLKQQVSGESTIYSGKCKGKDLVIAVTSVTGGTTVSFTAEGENWGYDYVVSPWTERQGSRPHAKAVVVMNDQGVVLYRGYLTDDGHLLNENHEFDWDNSGFSISIGYAGMDEWANYEPSILTVVKLALEPELVSRGSVGIFVLMMIAALCLAVDILVPELFFQLQHFLDVRDPEPSDFYIATQRLGWAVFPVLIAVGYCFAVTCLPS